MDTKILLENGTNELEVLEFTIGENSYGINVAKLANLPEELISRSTEILEDLLKEEVKTNSNVMKVVENKLPKWAEELKSLDPLSMSPLQALNYLYELKRKMGDK